MDSRGEPSPPLAPWLADRLVCCGGHLTEVGSVDPARDLGGIARA
jgi:hypothetical protein